MKKQEENLRMIMMEIVTTMLVNGLTDTNCNAESRANSQIYMRLEPVTFYHKEK